MKDNEQPKHRNISLGRAILGSILVVGTILAVSALGSIAAAPDTNYVLRDASAIQMTQVYTMELFRAAIVIGYLLAGLVVVQILHLMVSGE